MKKLYILILVFFFNISYAQPGFEDITPRYSYTILDNTNKEISFNNDYQIIIDSVHYKVPNIPEESLKKITEYSPRYPIQIRINNFSKTLFQKNNFRRKKQLEIKIVHKKDTMFICQSSGKGSFSDDMDISKDKSNKRASDFTLQFIKGHYYFPSWAKSILKNIPQTRNKIKIVNISQRHFIVPKKMYDLVYNMQKEEYSKLDNSVLKNFMKGNFSVNKKTEFTTFDKPTLSYKNPNWYNFLPTKDSNLYFGMISYSRHFKNCWSSKNIFSVLNKEQNTITQFFPKKNIRRFRTDDLYVDHFNSILYLSVSIKKGIRFSDCDSDFSKKRFYFSKDDGKSWQKSKFIKNLFKKYNLKELEFLDKSYAIAYSYKLLKPKLENKKPVQGIYYLLKNLQVIDSLKTPSDIHYDTNYNNYNFNVKNDTILLGRWTYHKKNIYFQPFLNKLNDHWKFKIAKKTYSFPIKKEKLEVSPIKKYQNFKIKNNRELVFNNGLGTLKLNQDLANNIYKYSYYIIEKNNRIYLINYNSLYLSFDKGNTWYLYPIPL